MSEALGTQVDVDAGLVEALRRDDPGAAEQLVERYGERVYRLAVRITGTSDDAEAAAQDALSRAARTIDTFKGESAFGSWIGRIAAGAAYQKLRTRRPKTGTAGFGASASAGCSCFSCSLRTSRGVCDWKPSMKSSTVTAATSSRWTTGRVGSTSGECRVSCAGS